VTERTIHDPEGLNTSVWPIRAEHFITPVDCFFTRSHGPVPHIDPAAWRLRVEGLVHHPRTFTLEEIVGAFPRREVAATLVCAGLRRSELLTLCPMPGELPWGPEPVSTGAWTGVSLADLLRSVGIADQTRYVHFTGLDQVERQGKRFGFGGSIEVAKALSAEVLLAWQLNGKALPPEHGFPLRTVVPGWIGARSVKWLGTITLSDEPSSNYFQSKAYRVQREVDPLDPRDVTAGIALSEVPLNAAIVDPAPGGVVAPGRVLVRGWAMGEAGRPVTTVEVSANAGRDWTAGRIIQHMAWSWVFWEATVDLAAGCHTLVVRATDSAGTTQPRELAEVWNVKGYNNNAWHRVAIRAE
jgi:sulfite oxidase